MPWQWYEDERKAGVGQAAELEAALRGTALQADSASNADAGSPAVNNAAPAEAAAGVPLLQIVGRAWSAWESGTLRCMKLREEHGVHGMVEHMR
eukprot:gene4341-biopygen7859